MNEFCTPSFINTDFDFDLHSVHMTWTALNYSLMAKTNAWLGLNYAPHTALNCT